MLKVRGVSLPPLKLPFKHRKFQKPLSQVINDVQVYGTIVDDDVVGGKTACIISNLVLIGALTYGGYRYYKKHQAQGEEKKEATEGLVEEVPAEVAPEVVAEEKPAEEAPATETA